MPETTTISATDIAVTNAELRMNWPTPDAPGALEALEVQRVGQAQRIGEDLAPRLERREHHPQQRQQDEQAPQRDQAVEHDVGEAEPAHHALRLALSCIQPSTTAIASSTTAMALA